VAAVTKRYGVRLPAAVCVLSRFESASYRRRSRRGRDFEFRRRRSRLPRIEIRSLSRPRLLALRSRAQRTVGFHRSDGWSRSWYRAVAGDNLSTARPASDRHTSAGKTNNPMAARVDLASRPTFKAAPEEVWHRLDQSDRSSPPSSPEGEFVIRRPHQRSGSRYHRKGLSHEAGSRRASPMHGAQTHT
jgi:hypothetical protein